MSVQHIWNFSQLLGLFTCRKLVNLFWNFITETCKRPETPKLLGVDYVAKNWALAMMLKALPLVHFWSVLLLKEQMMTSVRKTLKMQVCSAQNRSISNEVFPENQSFLTDWFSAEFAPKIPAKSVDFLANLPLKIPQICLLFRDLSEALHSMVRSIRFENIVDRSRYKFGGKLALFMRFGTFFMMKKQSRITWNLVATLATKLEFLVAKEKMLVALATDQSQFRALLKKRSRSPKISLTVV